MPLTDNQRKIATARAMLDRHKKSITAAYMKFVAVGMDDRFNEMLMRAPLEEFVSEMQHPAFSKLVRSMAVVGLVGQTIDTLELDEAEEGPSA